MSRLLIAVLVVGLAAARELTDDDPGSDPARFMIVVEHEDGYHCSASLVSIRTGVTTARCARRRGGAERRELWALAAELVSARPPAPLAAAARRVSRITFAGDGRDPDDPALDMALLELEAPFGSEAHSRPILMATSLGACDTPPLCHAIRALPPLSGDSSTPGRRVRLRVVELTRAHEERCVKRIPHWTASRARMMCLAGEEICERDLGGGVVCGGKLCGVLSVAVGEEGSANRDLREGQVCGNTLAAQSVAHWRRFLQCAYTFRLCGSGDCAGKCTEQRLLEDKTTIFHATNSATVSTQGIELITRSTIAESLISRKDSSQEIFSQPYGRTNTEKILNTESVYSRYYVASPAYSSRPASYSVSTSLTRTTRSPLVTPSPYNLFDASIEAQSSLRRLPEFEPNRPDFKAAPIQSTRVGLKAGEYGDNAAEYSGEEAPAGPCTSVSRAALVPTRRRPPPAPAPLSAPKPPPAPALQAPVQQSIATSGMRSVHAPSLKHPQCCHPQNNVCRTCRRCHWCARGTELRIARSLGVHQRSRAWGLIKNRRKRPGCFAQQKLLS